MQSRKEKERNHMGTKTVYYVVKQRKGETYRLCCVDLEYAVIVLKQESNSLYIVAEQQLSLEEAQRLLEKGIR